MQIKIYVEKWNKITKYFKSKFIIQYVLKVTVKVKYNVFK